MIYRGMQNIDHTEILNFPKFFEPNPLFSIKTKLAKSEKIGPIVDINSYTKKIKIIDNLVNSNCSIRPSKNLIYSIALHIIFIICYLVFNYIKILPVPIDNKIIEISFGVIDMPTKTQLENTIQSKIETKSQATKTKDELAKLPKNFLPELQAKNSKDELVINKFKKKVKTIKNILKDHKTIANLKKIDDKKHKIKLKDYLKRKEHDLRNIADKNRIGISSPAKNKVQQQHLNALPKSPFENINNIPKAPLNLMPAGDTSGTNVANYDAYRNYLKQQLQLHWHTIAGSNYTQDLKCIVEFSLNSFGYLISVPKIVLSSGDKTFDSLSIQAAQASFPVSTPPPKDLPSPQIFRATYSGMDIN